MSEPVGIRLYRLRLGEWLIGAAALALLIDLVGVSWYSLRGAFVVTSAQFGAATHATGFAAHHILGPLLIIAVLFAFAAWVAQVTSRAPSLPVVLTVFTCVLTLVVGVALTLRVVFDPPGVLVHGAGGVETTRTDVGAVLGVVLTWLVFAGTWMSLRAEGIAARDAPQHIETLRLTQRPA